LALAISTQKLLKFATFVASWLLMGFFSHFKNILENFQKISTQHLTVLK